MSATNANQNQFAKEDNCTGTQMALNNDNGHNAKGAHCSTTSWLLLLFMAILLIATAALLVAILKVTLLANDDQCFSQNSPFQQPTYKLFATKTLYTSAFNYLNKPGLSPASLTIQTNTLNTINNDNNFNNYDKSSIYLPKIFSQQDSLESINRRLVGPESGCQVRQLHFIGRHAARLPSSSSLDSINKHIQDVQSRIDLAKYLSINTNDHAGQQQQQQQQQTTGRPQAVQVIPTHNQDANNNSNKTHVCFDPLVQFKQWSPFAIPEQGNLLMDTGVKETQAIAQRFKTIFPQLFDANLTTIDIGTTQEIRTAQTAIAFLKQLDNFTLDFCNLDQFPTDNILDKSKAYEIQQNICFSDFLKRYQKEKLYFHKKCQQYHKEELPIRHNFNLKEPNRTELISNSVSKKLKLSKGDQLTSDEVYAIYNACRYESALTASTSIWCNLFSEKELKFFEYLSDIDDYYNQAYGHPDQMRSACPVTSELIKSFRSATRHASSSSPPVPPTETHLYFTHSEVIQKILAASVDLRQDPEYSPRTVLDNLRHGTAPKSRQWQTSLFTPFSANLAFILYSCPRVTSSTSATDQYIDMDVTDSPFKVVASLNEQPILLDGCADYVCDLNQLLFEGRLNHERKCKLEEICKNNVVVT